MECYDNWTAIIPARAGSVNLPKKNLMKIAGLPLYERAVELALSAGATNVILTTDIKEILGRPHRQEVALHKRPAELATDTALISDVILDVLQTYSCELCILLQPTSPLTKASDIMKSIEIYRSSKADLVLSATIADQRILKCGFIDEHQNFRGLENGKWCNMNRQQLPKVASPNGAIYVFNAEKFLNKKSFPVDNIKAYIMEAESSLDIDNLEDFKQCENILRIQNENLQP